VLGAQASAEGEGPCPLSGFAILAASFFLGSSYHMNTFEGVRLIVGDVLQLGTRTAALTADSALLGNIPEFDSMAVVSVITALEDNFGIIVEDDEIDAATFETLGSLAAFVDGKL
jgi:acyl carrier protein